MLKSAAVAIAGAVIAAGAWASRPSAFGNQSKPVQATVRVLAVSSSSRQSFAGNQEIYLADVQMKHGDHQFARLVDQYPGFGLSIRPDLLRQRTSLVMKVTREPECDVSASKVFLAPGDDSIYDASVRGTLASRASGPIPCYKALHQTIRVAKQ